MISDDCWAQCLILHLGEIPSDSGDFAYTFATFESTFIANL